MKIRRAISAVKLVARSARRGSRSGVCLLGLLFGCQPFETLSLAPAPPGAQTLVFAYLFEGKTDVFVGPLDLALPPINSEGPPSTVTLYYRESLEDLDLEAGLVLEGPRPFPEFSTGVISVDGASMALTTPADLPPALVIHGLPARRRCPRTLLELGEVWAVPDGADCTLPGEARPELCYRVESTMTELSQAAGAHSTGAMVEEPSGVWLYVETTAFSLAAPPEEHLYTRVGRIRSAGRGTIDASTLEEVPVLPPAAPGVKGFTGRPTIRTDGLELFTYSSYPDNGFGDEEIFSSSRASTGERFGRMEALGGIQRILETAPDERGWPLLLPDHRTLLYWDAVLNRMRHGRRATTSPADRNFIPLEGEPFDGGTTPTVFITGASLGCDHHHLYWTRRLDTEFDGVIRRGRITKLDPFTVAEVVTILDAATGQPFVLRGGIRDMFVIESPTCDAIYVSNGSTQVLVPAPCP